MTIETHQMSPHEFSAAQAANYIREGQISCEDLIKSLLDRSERLNPQLNLWAELDTTRAIKDARQKDRELATSGPMGSLHGVPVGIKDIFNYPLFKKKKLK